jgi:hypothetical protein
MPRQISYFHQDGFIQGTTRILFSTLKMIKDFGATRVDWMYCENDDQLKQLRDIGIPFSLATNPQTPDSAGYTTVKTRIVNIEGKALTPPWMKDWKNQKTPYWGCVNNPIFKEVFLAKGKKFIDLGAYGIFVDDPRFNELAFDWGGCFCEYCVKKY